MNNEEIRQEIQEQILQVSGPLNSIWSKNYFDGFKNRDFNSTEKRLKKIRKDYKINIIASSIFAFGIIIYSILQHFTSLKDFDIPGLFIIMVIFIFIHTFNIYKIKVSLEHNLFLLRILEKTTQN